MMFILKGEEMKKLTLPIIFILGIFICMLDTTIMNVSLPNISIHLKSGLDSLSWALNIYLILFASLTIPLTRFAELYGIHKWFLIGVSLFAIGSLTSACASGLHILLVGRAIQSIGAAFVFPLSMTLGINLVDVSSRTKMIAILGITQGLAAALGPTIGGIVTQFLGWRWIFLINVPITIVIIILGIANLTFDKETNTKQSMDGLGAVLSLVFLFSLSLGMIQGRNWGWLSWPTVLCFIISLGGFMLFLVTEKTSKNPMIPLQLFANPSFSLSAVIIILSNLFLVATTVILPSYFTNIENFDSLHASLLIAPISIAIFIFSPISGFMRQNISSKWLLTAGFLIMVLGYFWLSNGALRHQNDTIVAGIAVGMGYGIITGSILIISAGHFTGRLLTASQSVTSVLRQVGAMLAVAIFITGLYSNLNTARAHSISHAQQSIKSLNISEKNQDNILKTMSMKMTQTVFLPTDTAHLPKTLSTYILETEQYTKNQLTKAFEKLYLLSIPFLLLGALISLFLKNKYL